MMPTLATSLTSAGAAPANAPTASTSAQNGDFTMLLEQIVGQPAREAITPLPVQCASLAELSAKALDETTGDAAQLGLVGLPLLATEAGRALLSEHFAALTNSNEVIGDRQAAAQWASRLGLDSTHIDGATMKAGESAAGEVSVADERFHLSLGATESSAQGRGLAAADVTRTIHAPVGHAQWADELGARLTTMTEQGRHAASLRLSPEHLGPLEVRISIRDDQASVWFGAAHADTRAAIEHALPRLREMFEAQGMSLADAGVFQEAPRDRSQAPSPNAPMYELHEAEVDVSASVRVKIGLVDAYA